MALSGQTAPISFKDRSACSSSLRIIRSYLFIQVRKRFKKRKKEKKKSVHICFVLLFLFIFLFISFYLPVLIDGVLRHYAVNTFGWARSAQFRCRVEVVLPDPLWLTLCARQGTIDCGWIIVIVIIITIDVVDYDDDDDDDDDDVVVVVVQHTHTKKKHFFGTLLHILSHI